MFKLSTHTFNLGSGVECEIMELTGEQQDILTKQDGCTHQQKLSAMLKSILVRVGTVTDITDDFIDELLGTDKRQMLLEARQFSLGFQKSFEMPFEYEDKDGHTITETVEIHLPDGKFPIKPLQVETMEEVEGGEPKKVLKPATYKEYSDIVREHETVLPKTGLKVRWKLLSSKGETFAANKKKKERSSNTLIEMRFPTYEDKKTDGKTSVWVSLSNKLNKLPILDIEHLRKHIYSIEGEANSDITFEHPEAELKSAQEKMVKMDVLGTVAFFFPSGRI